MSLRGVNTVHYWADDVAGAVAWYTELLGTGPVFTRPGAQGGYTRARPGAPPPGGDRDGGRPGADGVRVQYAKFRFGDHGTELALADRAFVPPGTATGVGGAIVHWQVDDVAATAERLLSMGAQEHTPTATHGPITTATLVDPFGNLLGLIHNPNYLAAPAT